MNSEMVELNKETFCVIESIPGAHAKRVLQNAMWDGLEARLVAYIFGQKLCDHHIKYPSDWKESLKDRFLPAALRKHWPVKFTEIEIKASALAAKIKLPEKYGPVPFMTYRESSSLREGDYCD